MNEGKNTMGNFSGRRVLVGCVVFIFVVMSGSGLHSAGYSLLAPTFGISMTLLGSLTMVLTVSGIISGILLTSLEKRFMDRHGLDVTDSDSPGKPTWRQMESGLHLPLLLPMSFSV